MKQFISDCKENGIKLLFVVSPRYGATTSIEYEPGFEICRQEGCEVLDYFCDSDFTSNKEFFKDSYHLNDYGAAEFTRIIANYLHNVTIQRTNDGLSGRQSFLRQDKY